MVFNSVQYLHRLANVKLIVLSMILSTLFYPASDHLRKSGVDCIIMHLYPKVTLQKICV